MVDVYYTIQMKWIFLFSMDLLGINERGLGFQSKESFCFGVFNKGFVEQRIFDEGVDVGLGICWVGMR